MSNVRPGLSQEAAGSDGIQFCQRFRFCLDRFWFMSWELNHRARFRDMCRRGNPKSEIRNQKSETNQNDRNSNDTNLRSFDAS